MIVTVTECCLSGEVTTVFFCVSNRLMTEHFVVRLADAQDEIVRLRAKSNLVDDLERQIKQLKNELYIATSKSSYLER